MNSDSDNLNLIRYVNLILVFISFVLLIYLKIVPAFLSWLLNGGSVKMFILSIVSFLINSCLLWVVVAVILYYLVGKSVSLFLDVFSECLRQTVIKPFELDFDEVKSRIFSGDKIYAENNNDGIFIFISQENGVGTVEYVGDDKVVSYPCKDMLSEIRLLVRDKGLMLYDKKACFAMKDRGFSFSRVN